MGRKKKIDKKPYDYPQRSSLSLESLKGPLAQAEKKIIIEHLVSNKGNILRTAYELFLNRNTLTKLIHRHGIDIKKIRNGRYNAIGQGNSDKQGVLEKGCIPFHSGIRA